MPRLIDLVLAKEVPICSTLGITYEQVEEGRVVAAMIARHEHHNPMGTVHGGVYCDLADLAMGIAMLTTLGDNQAMTTIELKINYFRPVTTGRVVASARVLHRGRTSGYVECDIHDGQQRLVARASSTCVLLNEERAAAIFAAYA